MSFFSLFSNFLKPITSYVNEIPMRVSHDLGAVNDTVQKVTASDDGQEPDTDDQDTGGTDNDVKDPDDLHDDQETGDADNDPTHGGVKDPEDLDGDQETGEPGDPGDEETPTDEHDDLKGDQDKGDADNDTDKGDAEEPGDLKDDQETGDADNDTVGGEVKDPDDLESDQETGKPGKPVEQPVSDPAISNIQVSGQITSDGVITYDERDESAQVSFELDGVAHDAAVEAYVTIDGRTYAAEKTGITWTAEVPAKTLNDGEIAGTVTVEVTDANGAVSTGKEDFDSEVTVDMTEPESSDPVIGQVQISGEATGDGTITHDEKSETVMASVAVTGIAEGATAEVSFNIDGIDYAAQMTGSHWIAQIPAENLQDGETISGTVSVKVTDASGEIHQETSNFDTDIMVDYSEPAVSDPVIGEVSISGEATEDGVVTYDEKSETIQASVAVSGIEDGAAAEVTFHIDGASYTAHMVGETWVANVPAKNLDEGETIDGSVSVKVTDASGQVHQETAAFEAAVAVDFSEPTSSDPVIGKVSFSGEATEDGTITYDEKDEVIHASFVVTGIEPGATAEVSIDIDGYTYDAQMVDGKWVADIPVRNLGDGKIHGTVYAKVTDADGTTKSEQSTFFSELRVDMTEPVASSDPVVDSVTFEGEILEDGKITSEEVNETFEVHVEVSGIEPGASTEVTVEVDGSVYATTNVNGTYVAEVPASELADGQASGTATVKVTDADGATSHASHDFNTTVETDFSDPSDGVYGPEVQSTGEVEMDLDSMDSYTTGKGQMGVESDFNITFEFARAGGGVTDEVKAAVIQMGEYISSLITADLEDREGIDDIVIHVSDRYRDGEGGIHGSAGVSNTRDGGKDDGLPYESIFSIDEADIESMMNEGVFNDIILHELLHAIGFGDGDNWENFVSMSETYGGSYRFTGEAAMKAYAAQHPDIAAYDEYSAMGVPVEANHGMGNAGAHWDRATFDKTQGGLMAAGTSEHYYGGMDAMTLAAFQDMGYETTWDPENPADQPAGYDELPAAVQDPAMDDDNDQNVASAEDIPDDTGHAAAADVDNKEAAQDAVPAESNEAVADEVADGWSVDSFLKSILGALDGQEADDANGEEDVSAEPVIASDTATSEEVEANEDGSETDSLLDALLSVGRSEISTSDDEAEQDMFAEFEGEAEEHIEFGGFIDADNSAMHLQADMGISIQPTDEIMG